MSEALRITAVHGNGRVTVAATLTVTYTEARCPTCNRLVMAVPGTPALDIRTHKTSAGALGRGPVTRCRRCGDYVEVIAHR